MQYMTKTFHCVYLIYAYSLNQFGQFITPIVLHAYITGVTTKITDASDICGIEEQQRQRKLDELREKELEAMEVSLAEKLAAAKARV